MAGAGVGDEHVETLERAEDALDPGRVRDVELDAGAADRGCDPLRLGAVEVGHDDVVPRLGEPLGVGAPEAVGAARDERDPPLRSSDDPERPRDEPLEPERGPRERVPASWPSSPWTNASASAGDGNQRMSTARKTGGSRPSWAPGSSSSCSCRSGSARAAISRYGPARVAKELLGGRARVEREVRQELHGVLPRLAVLQDAALGEQQEEARLVDQRVLVGHDRPLVVLGCERGVHRLQRVPLELGAGVEPDVGEERPAVLEDGVVLDVRAQPVELRGEVGVLGAPVRLEALVVERRPRGAMPMRTITRRTLREEPLSAKRPFGMTGLPAPRRRRGHARGRLSASVPPQAFMTWKENWVFPAVDTEQRVATLFHFSLRPGAGEGIFTGEALDRRLGAPLRRPLARAPRPDRVRPRAEREDRLRGARARRAVPDHLQGRRADAEIEYAARFPTWDFDDNALAPGASPLGDRGRGVFHFHHYEQALRHEGTITLRAGPRAGETIRVSGYANRDHSWGWREDLTFRHHHWLCASFEDRYVQGTVMNEQCYPDGDKHGGWISTASGNVAVAHVDTSDAYWLAPGEPLPRLDRDVRYRLDDRRRRDLHRRRASRERRRPPLPQRPLARPDAGVPGRPGVLPHDARGGRARGRRCARAREVLRRPDAAELTARSASRIPA